MCISVSNLDKKICDVEVNALNYQTYREFITEIENEFNIDPQNIDLMNDSELRDYLDFLDELCIK